MGRLIKTFCDGSSLEYDRGKFDDWCVYLTDSQGHKAPPEDEEYFFAIQQYGHRYGAARIYRDFVGVYNLTQKEVNADVLRKISEIASSYGMDSVYIDKLFTTLYLAMIAEENKQFTKLGKRIKRLGVYFVLLENKTIKFSANFMRGMKWRDIDVLCKQRGF